MRSGARRRAVKVVSFCHFPSACIAGVTSKGNSSTPIALPTSFFAATAFLKTRRKETLSETLPVGAKLCTPAGRAARPGAAPRQRQSAARIVGNNHFWNRMTVLLKLR